MIAHIVMFRPKPGWARESQTALADAIRRARHDIPAVRRFLVGARMTGAPRYAAGAPPDFPFLAIVEVDDPAGLAAYLQHPAHAALGQLFNATLEAAMVFDFEVRDAADVTSWLVAAAADARSERTDSGT